MKNYLVTFWFTLTIICLNAQWKTEKGNNPFDGDYKSAYVIGKGGKFPYNNPTFVVNRFDNKTPNFYISGIGYTGCSNNQISIVFNDSKEIYNSRFPSTGSDKDALFISELDEISIEVFVEKLKSNNKVYMRVSNSCGKNDYEFSLSGSTRALEYVVGDYYEKQMEDENDEFLLMDSEAALFGNDSERIKDKFLCDKPLQIISTFKPLFNDMPIKIFNDYFVFETINMNKSFEVNVFNRWQKNSILISIDVYSKRRFFYANPDEIFKLTDNKVIEVIKDNKNDIWKDCVKVTETELSKFLKE